MHCNLKCPETLGDFIHDAPSHQNCHLGAEVLVTLAFIRERMAGERGMKATNMYGLNRYAVEAESG